uniref:CHK kinase-like domain-containing protein n=1 Tax=Heliothis virescens TaxID=7102 RepID=A0A2A4JDU6_HELVI
MAPHNFDGEYASFNECQLEFINNVIAEQNIKAKKVVFKVVGQAGDNFIGHVRRICIEGENGNLNMIVKVAATSETARAATHAHITFHNEHIMYTEVLPKLVELQKAAGVPEEDLLKYAKCYGSLYEPPYETLILEDLNDSNYIMMNKLVPLSDECVRSILKNFACLHSLSRVLKIQEPETYADIANKLTETWSHVFSQQNFSSQAKVVEAEVLSVLDKDSDKLYIENKLPEFIDLLSQILEKEDHKYSVIQQGDAWTNNFMFKMGGESIQTIMIDYQASSNGSPAVDLLFMMLNCTDHESRSKHFHDWLDYYHTEFDKSLSTFGLKADVLYPRTQLSADLKKYGRVMFYLCITFNTFLMRDSREAEELSDAIKNVVADERSDLIKAQQLSIETVNRIKNRVSGIIATYELFDLY